MIPALATVRGRRTSRVLEYRLDRPAAPSLATEPTKEPAAGDGLPLLPPLTALAELAFAFALIFGIDWLYPQLAVLDMQPHPFWIPVLMLGLQYGTVSGLVAAGAAIAATLFGGLPEAGIGENHFAYFLRVWGQPILWIAMALLVGQFRMRQIAAKQELRRLSEALVRQRDDLARHATGLRDRCALLERELAARRDHPPQRALALVARLSASEPASRSVPLSEIVDALFPGARARLYLMRDGDLVEQDDGEHAGATAGAPRLSAAHPLAKALLADGKPRSVLDPAGEKLLDGLGLAAVPVRKAGERGIAGVVILERAASGALTADGIAALDYVAGLLAPRQQEPLPSGSTPDHGTDRLRTITLLPRLADRLAAQASRDTPDADRPLDDEAREQAISRGSGHDSAPGAER